MRTYQHLTQYQRYYICTSLKSGKNASQIAKDIEKSKSTVYRELSRNQGLRGYRHKQANEKACKRQAMKGKARISVETWAYVTRKLVFGLSPEQIAGSLLKRGLPFVSHEWIYQYILKDKQQGGTLYKHLRCQKKRKKRYGRPDRRGQIVGRVSIDNRPAIVATRERLGDWEADVVEGSKGGSVLVTLAERKSRFALIAKCPNKSAKSVSEAIISLLTPLRAHVKTITYDNGKEFAFHQKISDTLEAQGYFAHPYHSWERGLNENTNGLLRQYFPKGQSLAEVKPSDLHKAMVKLNWRPRKCLGFKTPFQAFLDEMKKVAL